MDRVIEILLERVAAEPLPVEHTSSHWLRYGQETVVERRGNELLLRASGFEIVTARSLPDRALSSLERLSYRSVTMRLRSYPAVWRVATTLVRDLSATPNFNVFKSACVLSILVDHFTAHRLDPQVFALIGDGYGFLGALLRRYVPASRLYCIDLPKQLVFQARTHRTAHPHATMAVLSGDVQEPAQTTFVAPGEIGQIDEMIDCAINVASMQEMAASSISAYFDFLRRRSAPRSRFYCVNRQVKELVGGEVAQFYDYPWRDEDEVYIDGPCPYYTHFFARDTRHSGPRVLGVRVPFVNAFDGVVLHRLAHLAP